MQSRLLIHPLRLLLVAALWPASFAAAFNVNLDDYAALPEERRAEAIDRELQAAEKAQLEVGKLRYEARMAQKEHLAAGLRDQATARRAIINRIQAEKMESRIIESHDRGRFIIVVALMACLAVGAGLVWRHQDDILRRFPKIRRRIRAMGWY